MRVCAHTCCYYLAFNLSTKFADQIPILLVLARACVRVGVIMRGGAVCDPDVVNDYVLNRQDNCWRNVNHDQTNQDGDLFGDVRGRCHV